MSEPTSAPDPSSSGPGRTPRARRSRFLAQVRTTVGEVEATHHFRLEPLQSENRFHFGGPVALYADPSSIWTLTGRFEDVENPA